MTRFVKWKTWIGRHRGQIHAVVSGVLAAYVLGLLALFAASMIGLPTELQLFSPTLDTPKEGQQQRMTVTKSVNPSSGPVMIPPELALVQKDIRDLSDKILTLDQTVKGLEKELSQTSYFDSLIVPLLLAIFNELLRRNRPPSTVS